MKSGQIHQNILNIEMNMREPTIGRNILNIAEGLPKDMRRFCIHRGLPWLAKFLTVVGPICELARTGHGSGTTRDR
jgi:hypothetical protein